mgnify:CR=1 FL=1
MRSIDDWLQPGDLITVHGMPHVYLGARRSPDLDVTVKTKKGVMIYVMDCIDMGCRSINWFASNDKDHSRDFQGVKIISHRGQQR